MNYLFNFIIAIFVWLGLFNLDLVKPLIYRPLGSVLVMLTALDYLLLLATFIAVSMAMQVLDRFLETRKRRAAN